MRKRKQNYESIKEFIQRANISRTTLHRFYVKNPDLTIQDILTDLEMFFGYLPPQPPNLTCL